MADKVLCRQLIDKTGRRSPSVVVPHRDARQIETILRASHSNIEDTPLLLQTLRIVPVAPVGNVTVFNSDDDDYRKLFALGVVKSHHRNTVSIGIRDVFLCD